MNDIIERMKHNERPFGLLNEEERECLRKVGKENCCCLAINSTPGALDWTGGLNLNKNPLFVGGLTYRIKPDYKPEPRKRKIRINSGERYLGFEETLGSIWGATTLIYAMAKPNFIAFEYEDGTRSIAPRLKNNDGPALIPKYVVLAQ